MLQIKALRETAPQWKQVCAYAKLPAPGKPGLFLQGYDRSFIFPAGRVFAAYINEEIAGYCTPGPWGVFLMSLILPISAICLWTEKYRSRTPEPKSSSMRLAYAGNWVSQGSILSAREKGLYENMDLPN